jgi:serine/alanine adding enzyme
MNKSNLPAHFFHSPLLNSITSHSSYFTPDFFSFSFFDDVETFDVLGLKAGNKYTKRVVFYDFPHDFTDSNKHRNLKRLLTTIGSKYRDCVYIELRNLGNLNYFDWNIIYSDFIWQEWLNIIVDTSNRDQSWNSINEGKKRQIRSSLKKGAEIIEAENEVDVRAFYEILRNRFKKTIHKPLPDWGFFKAFYEETKGTEWGRYLLVKHKGKIIAGMMCPVSPGKEVYEWYVSGLDQEYKGTGIYPSVFATWAGIDYAIKNNIPQFNFMGAGAPDKPYGVRDFKMQFGGELVNAGRYVKVNKPFLYKLGKLYFRLREII